MVDGPARRAVSCPLCNEKFFPASLPFHQKQCEKRRAEREVPCPYCGKHVIQLDLPKHVKTCPKGAGRGKAKAAPAPGAQSTLRPEQVDGQAGDGGFVPQVTDDGRMSCMFCGRFFGPERICAHQEICGKLKSARPVGLDGKPTQVASKVFSSHAQRQGGGACFVSQKAYQQKQATVMKAAHDTQKNKDPAWRRAHAEFQSICKAGRGEPVEESNSPPRPASNMTTCPHCSRNFARNAADRHIAICANVKNRPKPPPSPSPSTRHARGPDSPPSSRHGTPKRGHSPAPNSQQRTLRPSECDSPLSPTPRPARRTPSPSPASSRQPAAVQHISDGSGAPGSSGSARSASCGRLPSVGTPNGAGGGALQAARELRRNNSTDKLPQLSSPGAGGDDSRASLMNNSSSGGSVRRPPQAPRQRTLDSTTLPGDRQVDDGASDQVSQSGTLARVGLKRCAMMYRLLSQVPSEALARELVECGVDSAEELDQEALIEAIIEQLA